jgi:hypothetical protein
MPHSRRHRPASYAKFVLPLFLLGAIGVSVPSVGKAFRVGSMPDPFLEYYNSHYY